MSVVITMTCVVHQIQKMVISGGDFKPDTLKPKEVVSLLLDDEEMETRCKWYQQGWISTEMGFNRDGYQQ